MIAGVPQVAYAGHLAQISYSIVNFIPVYMVYLVFGHIPIV